MPSDDTTVATQADFVPMAVGNTDRVRSVVSVSAHDGFSHHLRSGVQQGQLSVLTKVLRWELSLPGQLFIDVLGLFRAVRIQCMPPMPPPIISGPPRATQSVSHAVQETGRANTRRLSSS